LQQFEESCSSLKKVAKTLQKLQKDLLIPYYKFRRDTITVKTFVQQVKTHHSIFTKSATKFKSAQLFSNWRNFFQIGATFFKLLQLSSNCCNFLQIGATFCNFLQLFSNKFKLLQLLSNFCNELQRRATSRNELQLLSNFCNELQHLPLGWPRTNTVCCAGQSTTPCLNSCKSCLIP
jgi:hypothetical protein